MEIRNRLFPYPVLCQENDDYMNSNFNISVKQIEELKDIVLYFDIEMSNEELSRLIRKGDAEYVIHVECSSTSFRKIIKNDGKSFSYRIPKSKINKEIFLVGMIIAKRKIKDYFSADFNEDYDEKIDFEKGSILAYRNLPRIIVIKEYEELATDDSFFSIVCKNSGQDIEEPVNFDLSGNKIKIFVDEPVYNEYIKFHTNPVMKPIMISMLVMPALSYVIEDLRLSGADNYISCYWYQKISKACELQGKDFYVDIIGSELTSIELAQEMLQLPIGKALKNLSVVVEE